jgi:protein TonB
MNNSNLCSKDYLELIFERKNKNYGAYAIRNTYVSSLNKAMLISLSAVALVVALVVFNQNNNFEPIKSNGNLVVNDSFLIIPVNIEPEKLLMEKKPIAEKVFKPKTDDLNFKATDEKVETDSKLNDDAVIKKDGVVDTKDSSDHGDKKEILDGNTIKAEKEKTVYVIPDVMPTFNGDLMAYLRDHIRYPQTAIDNRTSGTVVLTFIVDEQGEILSVKPLKQVEDGCTEEAIRVVKSMPKWNPGKMKGESVRVQFNLPVKFKIRD